jgi:hypothetical protein
MKHELEIHQRAWSQKLSPLLWLGGAILASLMFSYLVTPLLYYVRRYKLGSWYWLVVLLGGVGSFVRPLELLSLVLFHTWLIVGLYNFFSLRWTGKVKRVVVVTAFSSTLLTLLLGLLSWRLGASIFEGIPEFWGESFKDMEKLIGFSVLWLSPSLLFFMGLTGSILVPSLSAQVDVLAKPQKNPVISPLGEFLSYRGPDWLIWVFMASVFMAFFRSWPWPVKMIGANLALVVGSFYFYQGVAVMEYGFLLFRAGLFPRILVYVLLAGYFFLICLAIGLADYWLDLRTWLTKKRFS